jgi:hypothetical protein
MVNGDVYDLGQSAEQPQLIYKTLEFQQPYWIENQCSAAISPQVAAEELAEFNTASHSPTI